jgi:RNA polymerase sigma-70 factor (ECF subfamily)
MPFEEILKLKEGDHKVFKTIYEEWSRKVFHYFLKKTGDDDVSKDLTQQVFIKLWNYRTATSTEYSIDQQLFQKARLIYFDWLRLQATRRKHFSGEPLASAEIAADRVECNLELLQQIEHSINSLPPRRRKVFELKHIEGYSYNEIANHLGITVKTVDNHLLKAVNQLKKVFHL